MQKIFDYFVEQDKNIGIKKNDKITLKFIEKNDKKKVEIYKNKKLFLTKSYKVIGLYNETTSVWHWGWAIDFVDKSLVEDSIKIKKWGKDFFMKKKPKSKNEQALYFFTKTNSFMTNVINTIFLSKLAMYVLKGQYYFIYTHKDSDSQIIKEYIII